MRNYNLESVEEMAGGDQDFVKVVVQTFLEEIPPDLEAMNQAIIEDNPQQAYQYAHKMKPNFQMFGLGVMPQIKVLEGWAKAGDSKEGVNEAARIITDKYKKAEKELKEDFDL
ncbi:MULTISPECIES: Hpt domain-containing protein [Salinimicrobium]|uniref:Hpt domain-containing protein n=1 Tax=Salinimicrobium TaxID=561367 RepID=UPI001E43C04A|nr:MULTISPECIES: Hpt domain-containing protein [Salinimicrobium]MCC8360516.1 Hpt domain-containing protein [Salinimicrobium sediminilitoris]MCY2687438.1 Hpt domain-containing protein [Salinimicrobium sp. TH3]